MYIQIGQSSWVETHLLTHGTLFYKIIEYDINPWYTLLQNNRV